MAMHSGAQRAPSTAYTTRPIVPTTAASQATAVRRLRIDAAIEPAGKAGGGSATMRTAGFGAGAGGGVPGFEAAICAPASSARGGSLGAGDRSRDSPLGSSPARPAALAQARL